MLLLVKLKQKELGKTPARKGWCFSFFKQTKTKKMETTVSNLCPKGGEHNFEQMTALFSGMFCTKCWMEKELVGAKDPIAQDKKKAEKD